MPHANEFATGQIVRRLSKDRLEGEVMGVSAAANALRVKWDGGAILWIPATGVEPLTIAHPASDKAPDMVNHPPHYTSHPKGIECISVIEDASDLRLGTAIKYIWRVLWGSKGRDVEDIEKAVWYLNRWLAEKKAVA